MPRSGKGWWSDPNPTVVGKLRRIQERDRWNRLATERAHIRRLLLVENWKPQYGPFTPGWHEDMATQMGVTVGTIKNDVKKIFAELAEAEWDEDLDAAQ